jgi:MT-A70
MQTLGDIRIWARSSAHRCRPSGGARVRTARKNGDRRAAGSRREPNTYRNRNRGRLCRDVRGICASGRRRAVGLVHKVDHHLRRLRRRCGAPLQYKTVGFYWSKTAKDGASYPIGTGYWTCANPELCLLATRGKPKRLSRAVRKLIVSPRREHSRKPDEVHERIEALVAGPYLELFARSQRPGWECWECWGLGSDIGPQSRGRHSSKYPSPGKASGSADLLQNPYVTED